MEIKIYLSLPVWKYGKSKRSVKKMESDGWTLNKTSLFFFSRTHSFSKII